MIITAIHVFNVPLKQPGDYTKMIPETVLGGAIVIKYLHVYI